MKMINTRNIAYGTLIAILSVVMALPVMTFASTIQLPKTGQTKCYDATGNEISCAGTGQDGDIQAGVVWPNPRFTDHGNGTITDNLTGLMWTKDANLTGSHSTWQQALDYVKTLNTGGHTDWRLPNVIELKSLVDYTQYGPALPLGNPFTNVQTDRYQMYCSSTTDERSTGQVEIFFVWMYDGYVGTDHKNNAYYYAWPVRAGQCGTLGNSVSCLPKTGQTTCWDSSYPEANVIPCTGTGQDGDIQAGVARPNPRFTDYGNGTITDNLTGLMWTKDANLTGRHITWQQALDYVKTLNTGGHTDWRLPNVNELYSLVDYSQYSPALPLGNPFTNVQLTDYYWSSTTNVGDPTDVGSTYTAWWVSIYDGTVYHHWKPSYTNYLWPVRAGGSFGTSTIYTTTTTSIKPTTTTVPTTTTSVKQTTTIPVSTTTTTICSGPCCAEAIYGENSEKTELLRRYRDNVLSKSSEGREFIKVYYKLCPTIVDLLESRPALKNRAKAFIDSMLPGIRKKVEEINKE